MRGHNYLANGAVLKHRVCKLGTYPDVQYTAANTDVVIGCSLATAADNEEMQIETMHGQEVTLTAGALISAGAYLMPTSDGKVITATTGGRVCGKALTGASADGKTFQAKFYDGGIYLAQTEAEYMDFCLNVNVATLVGTGVTRVVAPKAGTITKIYSVISGALGTGDATLTASIGGAAVTGGVVTITQSGSAAGDVDSATPTALNTFAAGDVLEFTVGGTNDQAVNAQLTLLCQFS